MDKKLINLGTIHCNWDWNYDSVTITAKLAVDVKNNCLLLGFNKVHRKSGLGKGIHETKLDVYNVGTIKHPLKKQITSYLAKHKLDSPFPRMGWYTENKSNLTLNEMLNDAYENNNDIIRAFKLSELKKRIKTK